MARDIENFRKNLKILCHGYGKSSRLAEKAGIHRVHLCKIISGKTTPGLDVAIAIAEALDMPLDSLVKNPTKSRRLAKVSA